jgi:hypothetical protein
MSGERNTTLTPRGGTTGHMHQVLDGLSPAAAVAAVEHEFTGWHVHLTRWATVWADTGIGPDGTHVTLRAPNAARIWQEIAATENHWWAAARTWSAA